MTVEIKDADLKGTTKFKGTNLTASNATGFNKFSDISINSLTPWGSQLNVLDGITATTAELNILSGVTATASELNKTDVSDQTETITTGAIHVQKKITNVNSSSGPTITLAAPHASMLGHVKTIQCTVAGGSATLALTNVTGVPSSNNQAVFDAVDETLVLVGGTNKWHYVGHSGVTLSTV